MNMLPGGDSQMFPKRIQETAPVCGQELKSGPPYISDVLLDNLFTGLATRDVDLAHPFGSWRWYDWTAVTPDHPPTIWPVGTAAMGRQNYVVLHDTGQPSTAPWRALTPGFMLPGDGADPDTLGVTPDYRLGDVEGPSTFWRDDVGTTIPSRVARLGADWNFLWHGQCTVGGAAAWCLPDHHPRLAFNGASGVTIVPASACDVTSGGHVCYMGCPGGPAPDNQEVKYDFRILEPYLNDVFNQTTLPVFLGGAAAPIKLSQRASLSIAPFGDGMLSYTDGDLSAPYAPIPIISDGMTEDWSIDLSPPAWLTNPATGTNPGCGILYTAGTLAQPDDADYPDTAPEVYPWKWVQPAQTTYVTQVTRLVSAMAGDTLYVQGAATTPGATGFAGYDADPRVYSLDMGLAGVWNEWNMQGVTASGSPTGSSFRQEAGLRFDSSPSSACKVAGTTPTFTINASSWWADLADAYMDKFPVDSTGRPAHVSLVGKFQYPVEETLPTGVDARNCYLPDAYVAGRRGTHPVDDRTLEYTGRKNGLRYNAWGQREIVEDWTYYNTAWNGTATTYKASAYAILSGAWRLGPYQSETWNDLSDLMSETRKIAAPGLTTARYGVWDLDASVRFSIGSHQSLFDLKTGVIPAAESRTFGANAPPSAQRIPNFLCDCSGAQTASCVATELQQLLTSTGYRIRLRSKSFRTVVNKSTTLGLTARFMNMGNAPPYGAWNLEMAFVRRGDFDFLGGATTFARVDTFPRQSFAPPNSTLASLLTEKKTFTIAEFDPRDIPPATTLWATSDARWNDTDYDGNGVVDADEHCSTASTSNSLIRALFPGYTPADQQMSDTPTVTARLTLPVPATADNWVILYRFNDVSIADTGHQVPMDLPTNLVVGDQTDQRWAFFGYLTTE